MFKDEITAVTKILFKSLFGPFVMIFIFVIYLMLQSMFAIFLRKLSLQKSIRKCFVRAFLIVLLFAYQQLVIGAFTLVKCVNVYDQKVLSVQGEIICYTWWQRCTEALIVLLLIPLPLKLSHAPFYLENNSMSVGVFIFACIFPIPVILSFHAIRLLNKRSNHIGKNVIELSTSSEIISSSSYYSCEHGDDSLCGNSMQVDFASHSDTEICSEYSTDFIRIKEKESRSLEERRDNGSFIIKEVGKCSDDIEVHENISGSKNEILHTLLDHYKMLSISSIKFSWLGFHKIYRIILVACNTYIADPLTRINVTSSFLLIIAVRPYKERTANITATLSYAANICIAVINVCKATLQKFDCIRSFKGQLLTYLGWTEKLMLYSYLRLLRVGCKNWDTEV